jgi:hypothetical protein
MRRATLQAPATWRTLGFGDDGAGGVPGRGHGDERVRAAGQRRVGRCRLPVSKPELKARLGSAP